MVVPAVISQLAVLIAAAFSIGMAVLMRPVLELLEAGDNTYLWHGEENLVSLSKSRTHRRRADNMQIKNAVIGSFAVLQSRGRKRITRLRPQSILFQSNLMNARSIFFGHRSDNNRICLDIPGT